MTSPTLPLPATYRGRRGLRITQAPPTLDRGPDTYMAPTSFTRLPVPDNVAYDTAAEAQALPALANPKARAAAGSPRISGRVWAPYNEIAEKDAPLVPIKMMRPEWGGAVPNWAKGTAAIMAHGVPINLDAYLEYFDANWAAGDRDNSFVVISPDYVTADGLHVGKEWPAWRARRSTDADAAAGFPLTVSAGCVAMDLAKSPGYPVNRLQKGWDYYKNPFPTDPVLMDSYEIEHSGISASGSLGGPLTLTLEDWLFGIGHVVGLAFPKSLLAWTHRWPAWSHDSVGLTNGAPFMEGMRLHVPRDFDVDAWAPDPVSAWITRGVQEHGAYISDGSTIIGASFEQGLDTPGGIIDSCGFDFSHQRGGHGELLLPNMLPWDHVRILAGPCTAAQPYLTV